MVANNNVFEDRIGNFVSRVRKLAGPAPQQPARLGRIILGPMSEANVLPKHCNIGWTL